MRHRLALVAATSLSLCAAQASAEGTPPVAEPVETLVDARVGIGLGRSTDGDELVHVGGYLIARHRLLAIGVAAQWGGTLLHGSDSYLAAAAGVGWSDDAFRVTALGLLGAQWWRTPSANQIGRGSSEETVFVGVRGDAEIRLVTVDAMRVYFGFWASGTVDLSQERISLHFSGDPEYFIKGQTRVMGGLQLGATF